MHVVDAPSSGDRVLIIVGASARAAAQSAIRAGFDPWCADLYADRDLGAIAPVVQCPADRYPHGLLDLLDSGPAGPVLLTGGMENVPELVEAIGARRPLLGSGATAIRLVRQPEALRLADAVDGLGWAACDPTPPVVPGAYLVKPLRGCGGRGIRPWHPGQPVPSDHHLQRRIEGTSISAVYRAEPDAVHLVGLTEQLIGAAIFGARGFQYCGSIGPLTVTGTQQHAVEQFGRRLVDRFHLAGLFGVDYVLDSEGLFWPVEVNPRYTASVEVLERATGRPALRSVRKAGSLSSGPAAGEWSPGPSQGPPVLVGKAIVFARHRLGVPDLFALIRPGRIADVPPVGQSVEAGRPICTLLARGPDRAACLGRLGAMARCLYRRLSAER